MRNQEDIKIQERKNAFALKVGWFLLVTASVSLIFTTLFAYNFNQRISVNKEIVNTLNTNRVELQTVITTVEEIISNDKAIPLANKTKILDVFSKINTSQTDLKKEHFGKHLSESDQVIYQDLLKEISKSFADLTGISNLIISQKKGIFENKDIITDQLKANKHHYRVSLNSLNSWLMDNSFTKTTTLIWAVFLISIFFLLLVVLTYSQVIIPFKQNILINNVIAKEWSVKIDSSQRQSNQSELKRKESELILKTKNAQVIKLQQSLEESMLQTEVTKISKKQIYYDIASELEQHASFLTAHFQVIENQTDVSSHENWLQLSSNLDRLNHLVSKFYDSAQEGTTITSKQEVYLTPLLSEVIISNTTNGSVSFKQLEDLPTILTDEIELKRILLPFIEFISTHCENKTVQISVIEKKNTCEFKFVGLPISFKKSWDTNILLEEKILSRSVFKLQHAIKSINDRGGKTWGQFDIGDTGILTISWVL